ncbi:YopX family protein [Clostridium botulinum]|uniref:YopX family protein n=1 Tax=Clostridium botulinum TaxID=1491 RepID=UPI00174CAFE4|nr:YopX family protein [Clostridium botulinum]MBD5589262.1 hypothetical protein [Clostridium botulinum]
MKEIKFRGKRIDNGEWIYGNLIKDNDEHYYIVNDHGTFRSLIEVIPKTVGEYTGLKDKNSKEIYEGDIVRVSEEYAGNTYMPMKVGFKNQCFVLINIYSEGNYNPMFEYDFTQKYEVIGNIYDNPELLN